MRSDPTSRTSHRSFLGLLTAGGLLVASWSGGKVQAQGAAGRPLAVPGQYIVVLDENVPDPAAVAAASARRHGLEVGHVFDSAIKGFVASVPPGRLAALAAERGVRYVEQDQVVWADGQGLPTGVKRLQADLSATARIDGIDNRVAATVAVIDTGIQLDHPELNVDRRNSKSFVRKVKIPRDGNGHGTHVAGTIGALDNGAGVVGVAPGVSLWAVKVLDDAGTGYTSDVIAGVNYVTQNASQVAVANMSLGGGYSQALNDAVAAAVRAGVVFAVAAGNSSQNASTMSPASEPSAITVAALADSDGQPGGLGAGTNYGADDTFATFSNYGDGVDVIAPGVSILSTWNGSSYNTISGTSMATPHVAGAAALYVARYGRDLTGASGADGIVDAQDVAAIQAGLIASATVQIPGRYDSRTYPLVNVTAF